jgi:hypothetical protein
MNPIREEHRVRIYKDNCSRDSFTGLWRTIASQQQFLKLKMSTSNPSTDEINEAITRRHGSISPYSAGIFASYIVIYKKGNIVIITNRPTQLLGTFFAVEDSDWENRYFVAFAFSVGCLTESITGMMVYFTEEGFCYSDRTIIYDKVIASYDLRNGKIRSCDMALYHQSLFFIQSHRDTHNIILYVSHLLYDSDTIDASTSYYTNYTSNLFFCDDMTICKRFIVCELKDKCVVFDLGSLEFVKEHYTDILSGTERNDSYLLFCSYILPSKGNVMNFLEMGSNFPEREYTDGYPINCIKCDQITSAGTLYFKSSSASYMTIGLGNSYCEGCCIRYSHTKKEWVCAKIDINGQTCDGFLQGDWLCSNESRHSLDQTYLVMSAGKQHKYPYRKYVRLQWMPSEDAIEALELSKYGKVKERSSSLSVEVDGDIDGDDLDSL